MSVFRSLSHIIPSTVDAGKKRPLLGACKQNGDRLGGINGGHPKAEKLLSTTSLREVVSTRCAPRHGHPVPASLVTVEGLAVPVFGKE
jgi:hypothetical protein